MSNAVFSFTLLALRSAPAILAAVAFGMPHTAAATTPLNMTTPPTPRASRAVVLVGEPPTIGGTTGRPLKPTDLVNPARTILQGQVVDRTTTGALLAQVQIATDQISILSPDIVIVLAGPADEKAGTPEVQQTYPFQSFARALTATGARVFVLPASPTVSATQAAVLRIAASGAGPGVHYVDLGSELAGRPFEVALERIKQLLEEPQPTAPAGPATTPKPTPAATPIAPTPATTLPELTPTPETTATATKARVPVKRLPEEPSPALPPALTREPVRPQEIAPGTPAADDDRGRVVVPGDKATTTTIQMRPPQPLKQFSPRRPAPNKPGEKKKPSFAR